MFSHLKTQSDTNHVQCKDKWPIALLFNKRRDKVFVTSAPVDANAWNRSGLCKALGRKGKQKNANKTEYNHVSVMAERQSAHTAICKEKQHNTCTQRLYISSNHHTKMFPKMLFHKASLADIILQMRYGRGGKKKQQHPFIHTSLTIADARRVVATWCHCDHFHFCIWIYLRCILRKYTSILYSFPSFL